MQFFTSLLRAGTVLETVPLSDVTYTRRLGGSGHGDLTGRLALADQRGSTARAKQLLAATTPWLCAVWAEDDGGRLRWGGPIISRPYKAGQGYVEVKAGELGAYFARRTIPVDRTHVAVDQLAIQRQLYADAQAQPGGDVGLQLPVTASAVLRDRTYLARERKWVEEASGQLSNVSNGFDYAWLPSYVSGVPRITLAQGYPALGAGTTVELHYPGDVASYEVPEEGAALATRSWALGKKDEVSGLTAQAVTDATAMIDAGYPLLEQVQSYTDVEDDPTLTAHAVADLAAQAGPISQVPVEVTLADLYASGVDLGNVVRLRIEDPARWPDGAELDLRVVAITERPHAGTATLTVADRVLLGGRVPRRGGVPELLASITSRLLRVEAV